VKGETGKGNVIQRGMEQVKDAVKKTISKLNTSNKPTTADKTEHSPGVVTGQNVPGIATGAEDEGHKGVGGMVGEKLASAAGEPMLEKEYL
ncbi:hypothetical protein HK097_011638, partial [Rhizophlyctis rosea]